MFYNTFCLFFLSCFLSCFLFLFLFKRVLEFYFKNSFICLFPNFLIVSPFFFLNILPNPDTPNPEYFLFLFVIFIYHLLLLFFHPFISFSNSLFKFFPCLLVLVVFLGLFLLMKGVISFLLLIGCL